MASNGSFNTSGYDGRYLHFSWSENSQSVPNNTTTISWTLTGAGGSSMWYMSGNFKVVIDGVTVYQSASRIQLKNGTVVASGTYTFQHGTDGKKTFSASAEAGIYTVAVNCRGSGSFTLDTIPRASTPSVSSSSVFMGAAVTINTNRASTAFTHDLAYSFAGAAWATIKNGVGASYSWTTPDLASKIPSASSGTVTIRCITKNGSTTVGTKTITLTLKVPTTVVPSVSTVTAVESVAGLSTQFGAFIKSKSKLKVTISAAGAKGSTIKSYSTALDGKNYTGGSFTSSEIMASGSVDLVTTVTDSRGRTAKKTTTIIVLDYAPPAITALQVYRVNASGTEDQDGVYVAVRYAYAVTALNSKNTARMVLEYKRSTATGWSNLTSGSALSADTTAYPKTATLSTDYQWDIRMTVTDYFGASAVYTAVLPSGVVIMDIGADGSSLGIGKTAERPGVCDVAMQMRFGGGVDQTLFDLIYPVGSIYMSVSSVNPGALFGGTWVEWGAGRVPVGVNTSDSSFNTVEKTGGSKDHHHQYLLGYRPYYGALTGSNFEGIMTYDLSNKEVGWTGGQFDDGIPNATTRINTSLASSVRQVQASRIGVRGNTSKVSNMPPYITCYMWKRTA